MNTTTQKSELIQELFLVLNEKEKTIITKRFSLNSQRKLTLEEIGKDYNITRERVRQIEKTAINKLRRTSIKTDLVELFNCTVDLLANNGLVMTEKKLAKSVSAMFPDTNEEFILLSFEINPELEKIKKSKNFHKTWYLKDKATKKDITSINTSAEKILKSNGEIMNSNDLISELAVKTKNLSTSYSKTVISAFLTANSTIKKVEEGYGLTVWRDVRPRSIRDKALIVLKRAGKPMHFKRLANKILDNKFDSKSVTTQAVHNELIRYDDFVLVGRGIYALKEWGFQDGTVKDVITSILNESGPLPKSKIVDEVLKRRQVKVGTISLNLQKYPEFKRVGRAVYSL